MTRTLSRRSFNSALGSAWIAGATVGRPDLAAASQESGDVHLGEDRDAFEVALGPGTDLESGLARFGEPDTGEIVHYVRFTDGIADHIEVDLTCLPGGGLPPEEANVGDSRFLPDDADPGPTFAGGNLQFETSAFDFAVYASPSVATSTGRSGNLLVTDEHGVAGDGMEQAPRYQRATISMESFDVHPVTPTGEAAVLLAPLETWWDVYGEESAAQRGALVANAPLEPMLLGIRPDPRDSQDVVGEIHIGLEQGIPIEEAVGYLGLFLQSNASLAQTHYAVPSPTGPIGIRTNVWILPSLVGPVYAVSMLYVNGGEENGTVDRIMLVIAGDE